jgi:succinyl-CoA synthetase beta subunit
MAGDLQYPVVIKAQVQTGNRGKLGGIQIAENSDELIEKGSKILSMTIKDLPVNKVFIVPKVDVKKEMYLSFTLDRKTKLPVLIFSPEGGVEINEIAEKNPDKLAKVVLSASDKLEKFVVQYAIDKTGLDKAYAEQFHQICTKLYDVFNGYDCMLAEINPLVVDAKGNLMALDGKVDVDDNSLYRHKAIEEFRDEITDNALVAEARRYDFLYIPIQDEGDIAVISNGSGMIMSSIDLISKRGMKVTCALDLGGGATSERIKEALRIVATNDKVTTIFINIFGGITRCDEIAGGVERAMVFISKKRLVLRLEGTNKEKGLQMIRDLGGDMELVDGLYEGVDALAKGGVK